MDLENAKDIADFSMFFERIAVLMTPGVQLFGYFLRIPHLLDS
jgi:hypothetical protein